MLNKTPLRQGGSSSGGCGQAVTQMRGHTVMYSLKNLSFRAAGCDAAGGGEDRGLDGPASGEKGSNGPHRGGETGEAACGASNSGWWRFEPP